MSADQRPRARRLGFGAILAIALAGVNAGSAIGLTWLSDTAATTSAVGYAYPGSLAASSTTFAHMAYEELVGGSYVVEYRRTTNSGSTWGTPIVLSRPGVNAAGVPAVDASASAVDAVWVEGEQIIGPSDSVVIYRRSTDSGGTWKSPVEISPMLESAGLPRVAHKPSSSTVGVVWTNQVNGKVYVRISTDGGATWRTRFFLATTTNKPFTGLYDGFPVITFGSGVIYVGYYSASKTLKVRRSTDGGTTWTTAQTVATNAGGAWPASIAATGSTVVFGYAAQSSTDSYAAFKRSTDKGVTWGSTQALEASGGSKSYHPVISYKSGFQAIFELCSSTCSTSSVRYRASSTGSTWSSAITASVRKRSWDTPAGVTVSTKVLVLYVDANSSGNNVYVRRGG
jgi:hypothetical protein